MSLVITSNTPQNQVNTTTTGINLPYSYTNHLQGTLNIPPNSEIAVQSVKINKTGNIQLNKFNTQFGFYMGRDQDAVNWNLNDDFALDGENELNNLDTKNNSLMIPTYILPKDEADKNFSYNTNEIATELQIAWNKSIYHPNLLKNTSASQGGGEYGGIVTAKRSASNQGFEGWEFTLTNSSDRPLGALPTENNPGTDWINAKFGNSAPAVAYPTITNPDTVNYEAFIGTAYPLNLVNGSFNCSFGTHRSASIYNEFAIGLTRACLPTATDTEDLPEWFTPQGNALGFNGSGGVLDGVDEASTEFFDWCIASVREEVSPAVFKHALKLFHNVSAWDAQRTQIEEYDYRYLNGGNYYYFEDELWKNVVFNVKDERMKIRMENGSGANASKTLVDGSDTGGGGGFFPINASNMKPVCPTTRFLYPKLLIKPTLNMVINKFYGVSVADHVYGKANYIDLWSQSKSSGIDRSSRGLSELLEYMRRLDTNIYFEYDRSRVNYKIINDQNGLSTQGDGLRLNGNFRIVSAPSFTYAMSDSLNTNLLLGFENNTNTPAETKYALANPNLLKWKSNTVPKMVSKESIFIRLKNMTFESANFSNSAMSKILYHVPTFDNSGNDVGSLHLEPTQMVYLDLNNTYPINLSTVEIDFVYNNEQLATGLEGKSVVVLHIRQKK